MISGSLAVPRTCFLLGILASLSACESPTAPRDGTLSVAIAGTPLDLQPSVTISGPGGYTTILGSSTTLSALTRGTYTIVAKDVSSATSRFAGIPGTQTVTVAGIVPTAANVTYAVASARLALSIVGLPAETSAAVLVSGPNVSNQLVTGTTTLDRLDPGSYTITANDVQAGGKTYHTAPRTLPVSLTASTTPASVVVAYGAGTASLDLTVAGLPDGTSGSFTVTGPGGLTRAITSGTTTLSFLDAGSYTIAANTVGSNLTTHVPAPASQTINVADGATGAATVTYGSAPLQLGLQLVADGLTAPDYLTAPDGDSRLFVVERNGRIRIIENGVLLPTPYLDITNRVNFTGERGMLSMAFDPLFATRGYFYVYYVDANSNLVIERFSATPGSNVAGASAGIVITIPHGNKDHHGGQLAFGPDGMLYAAPGDGGCCGDPGNNAQNLYSLLGKLLRLDVRTPPYVIPFGNPFLDRNAAPSEIWAYGLRNPWRFSFDAPTGLLYIGDVGNDAREEVDVIPANAAGANFGWRLMEGTACFNPSTSCAAGQLLTDPVLDYPHSDGCSVTGGYVYRGAAIPELTGHYLYADYCRGWLRSFRYVGRVASEPHTWDGITLPFTPSFGKDGAGELYMISGAKVWRIVRK